MSESFIKRPVMTTLVMLAILLFGMVAYRSLPVSDLPNVDFPTINVSAQLPGATPETMASAVALPLEKQFSTIAGISSMSSTSNTGNTSITIQFDLSRSIDAAAQDVQAAIANAASQLPPDMPTPPSYNKVNPADSPVIYLSLSSDTLPLSQVDEYAETLMAQQISMTNGVAQVQVYGSQKYAVRVELDPRQLASRQIGIDEVANAVKAANVNLPTGVLHGTHQMFQVLANGQLTTAKQYEPIVIAYRNGAPVRLGDLGKVADGVENDKVASWFSGTRAIILAVQRQPGTNTVEVVDSVKALLPRFRAQMPAAVNLDILYDRSASIRDSVSDVKFTLLLTMCLVILVIFLFLRNVSATIIPSLALPMSVVGTFAVMYLLGYSLDNLSLMALTLSVGFVVDDAIVMLENIVRHMEAGEGVLHASISGSKEIGFTIVSMTLSLTAVFIPVLFMGGIVGRLLHEFAVTIGAAILVSGMVSLSLTPMLCSRFLKPHAAERHGRLYQASERAFDGLLHAYDRSLGYVLRHRAATMAVLGGLLVATVFMFRVMPTGFLPNEDTGQIFGFTEAAQNISYDDMVRHQKQVGAIIDADPNIANAMSSLGRGAAVGATNSGTIFMRLKPRGERLPADQIIQELRPKLATVPGIQVYLQILPPIRIGGMLTKSQYQFTLQSPNTDELYQYAPVLVDKLRQQAGDVLQDVTTDLYVQSPQVRVNIDRDKASALGVSAAQVEDALFTSYGSRLISTIYAPSNEYRVIMELQPEYRGDPAALPMLYIRSSSGALVPLNAVASLTRTVGPLSINHLGQTPAVTVSFNTRPGISLGDAVARVQQIGSQVLPASITPSFQGTAQAFQSSFAGLGLLLAMAIAVIYIVLGILYESFIHPITILSGLPAAGFGALLTLLLFNRFGSGPWKMDLNLYAFVGIIMLVGIVKKNAIMMIDFALDAQRKEGKSAADAIYQGSLVRFRPIMMTTMAALMGTLPIALGFGAGSESRRPLGMAVVGGLVFSQLLTLFITPVVYTYMDTFQQRFGGKRKRSRAAEREAARELVLEAHPRAQSASD